MAKVFLSNNDTIGVVKDQLEGEMVVCGSVVVEIDEVKVCRG